MWPDRRVGVVSVGMQRVLAIPGVPAAEMGSMDEESSKAGSIWTAPLSDSSFLQELKFWSGWYLNE